jgi:hypothetical protein
MLNMAAVDHTRVIAGPHNSVEERWTETWTVRPPGKHAVKETSYKEGEIEYATHESWTDTPTKVQDTGSANAVETPPPATTADGETAVV